MADYHEVVFESEICAHLEAHGWLHSANDTGYDRERALFPEDLFTWLEETQKQAYEKALRAAGSKAKVLDVLTTALDKPLEHGGGTLNILRNGVQYIGGGRLKMAQFRPETSLNATTNEQYVAMRVRVLRQVHFSTADQRSIDLVFFINGLPIATAELKTDFTQSLDEAITQYRKNRHPLTNGRPEPLLSFGHRALVHFAVSNDLAAMTTRLEGEKTHFLPFDIGHDSGAGNPPAAGGRSATAYLWERVWERDAWLTIIGRLMIVETKEEWDVATGTSVRHTSMLFPRFHQWEAVTTIVAAVREEGVGQRYLIEHSAGSGKTNTIAWTAHRLARLHVNDEKVFDSVIVVVDRTVLVAGDAGPVELTEGQRHLHLRGTAAGPGRPARSPPPKAPPERRPRHRRPPLAEPEQRKPGLRVPTQLVGAAEGLLGPVQVASDAGLPGHMALSPPASLDAELAARSVRGTSRCPSVHPERGRPRPGSVVYLLQHGPVVGRECVQRGVDDQRRDDGVGLVAADRLMVR